MKTTIDVPDALLQAARAQARREDTTLRELVSEGLRRVLAEEGEASAYRYEPVVFDGELGTQPGVDIGDWATVRELIYGDGR
ncbi:MAG: type II toxin-antitoxin system VapB family antitoxin [Actinomycetota bacterium]|jgi:hypothetical protein|nr:type II toxin-antitoxin system VapB family antitoxin [Solirubrobacterales bacterium]MDQ3092770.1 type II toxin-antitoxin system VapB family antitoxin [Actinomycetota bacterium]